MDSALDFGSKGCRFKSGWELTFLTAVQSLCETKQEKVLIESLQGIEP